ncbi:hypothetical protein [Bacteroides fragilis]|uniref:hypothetical protein n=1 Tax=Bacteroides fragilis TaxID=817 RepID=UPI00202F7973|nr:hypothetical protein [Bacteroides fragilis]
MERVDIKDISGSIRFSTIVNEGSKRKFLLMKEDYVTVKFNLDEPIFFKLGDYIDDGHLGVFEICDIQKPAYNAITASYDYELRLDAYYWKWKNKIFKYTPETAGQEASWNLTAPLDVQVGIVLRNLKALGYTYKGQDFVFSIDSTVENKAQLMSYDNINILDACFEMAKKWDCECWVTESIIHFGRCEFGDPVNWEIGVNVEEMSRSDSQSTYATRIYAFGSTRNIPSNYRPVDETVVVNGVVQKRLMLPEGIPYIDAYPNMTTEEAIEQIVIFDEVYPRRVGTMSDITTKEYTETIENADGTTTEKKWNAYRFKDTGITFSKDYVLPGEELKITFQSGKLNGMMFAVTFDPDGKDEQLWEIVRNEDYGRPLPDGVLAPVNGDKYVLSGWDSTKITELGLVSVAEQELKTKAEKCVTKSKIDPNTYNCKMMSDDAYREDGIHNLYGMGQKVNLINKAYFENGRQSRIIGFEFNLDYPFDSPEYTVGETAAYSRIGELEEKIDSVTLAGQTYTGGVGNGVYLIRRNDSTPATDSNTFSALRLLAMFLRKDQVDTAKEIITFLKGLLIGKKGHGISVSDSGAVTAVFDELKNVFSIVSPDFVSGDLGNGFILKYDPKTGRSYLEVDELLVRKLAYFVELIIKRLSHVGGEIILTPASLKCSKVEVYDTYYRCYFEQDDGDKSIVQEFKAGDQARCQTFNVQEGTSHNVSNTYYWRLVTATGKNYIDLSIEDCDLGSMEPSDGDHIVQLGNRTDATRQNAIILSTVGDDAPSIKQYKGINGYTLRNKEVTILSPTLNKFLGQFISEVTGKSYDDMFSDLKADFDIVKDQVDREFTIWFFEYAPTLSNIPASDWTTDALKALHEQDIFYNRASGLAYRFEKNANGAYSWNSITDQQTVKALEDAAKAQDTADGKRRVFVAQPTNAQAYDIGDLWVNATYSGSGVNYSNDTLRCVTAKAVGAAFSISHWTPASNATTAYIKNLGDSILLTVGANDTEAKRLISVAQKAADAAGVTADAAKATGETNATAIKQNRDSISVVAGRFNSDGTLKNTSGLVTGNGTFATLFANAVVDGKIVKQADISTFITADQAGNLISNASIRADKVVFEGTSVKIASKYLDITGAVTFNSFNADLQGTINGKATTGYVDTAKTDAINSAASTAQSKVDALSNTLGSLAYKSAVEKAMLGTTLINGGYIRTDLIDAQTIVANALAADRITANYLTVTGESMIGGFKISGTSLASGPMTISTQNIQFSGDGITAGLGINTAPAALGLNVPLWINNNSSADKCIAARFSATGASEKENNIALALTGCISGFAVKLRSIASGGYLTLEDCFVSCSFTGSDQNVYLPKDPPVGKVYLIKRWPGTGRGPIVHANGSTLNGGATSDLLKEDNHLAICVWGGKSWSYNKISL